MSEQYRASRRWPLAIAVLGATTLLAACGSSATGSTAGPSTSAPDTVAASPSVSCAQVAALRNALANVSHIALNAKMRSLVPADLMTIELALVALKGTAQSVYKAEAKQIGADLTVLGQQAELLSLRPTATNMEHTKTALNELQRLVSSVITGVRLACPSA